MILHLLRHSKTNQISSSGKDFDRKLLDRGKEQARMMAEHFKEMPIITASVYCSSAIRTRETLAIIQEEINFSDITYLDHLYLASQASLLQFLWEKDAEDILIIGHNEGLSDLASYCMGAEIHLKTCSYIKINISASNWQESIAAKGQILDFYRPLI